MTPDFIQELRRYVGHAELWLIGVTVIVVRGEAGAEEVLLVKRADDGRWTPVTGIVEPGEEPDVAGVREALEETSVAVEIESLLAVQVTRKIEYPNGDRAQYLDHAFLARVADDDSGADEPRPADGENTAAEWVPLADVPPMGPRFDRTVELAIRARRDGSGGPGHSDVAVESGRTILFGAEERRR